MTIHAYEWMENRLLAQVRTSGGNHRKLYLCDGVPQVEVFEKYYEETGGILPEIVDITLLDQDGWDFYEDHFNLVGLQDSILRS